VVRCGTASQEEFGVRLPPVIATLAALLVLSSPVLAYPPFKKAFEDRYVKGGSPELKKAFEVAGCNACHVTGATSKQEKNLFGSELDRLLTNVARRLKTEEGKAEVLKELEAAFDKVEQMKSPTGETWAERIRAARLP
jgi:hypothetical protein